jgi:UDP-N-acetylglucosamine diphosphorylase / glucose-1-phosphate thymidylyltransferase / UDP-N-acetylgalactosamine diphosphorylase / glucosamine-1-phosphate N-acetyltransferase / galactosamine-1-phosphate N-acetyltransferase
MTSTKTPVFVILAGGIGKRFFPLTINKTLLPLFGKPLLQHTLEMIERVGGEEVVIVASKENEEWLHTQKFGLKITIVNQPEPKGMGDALLLAEPAIGDHSMIVMNSVDMVADDLLIELLKKTAQEKTILTGIEQTSYFPGGYLEVDGDQVTSIIEKPGEGNEPSNLVNLVFHYFSEPKEFISLLKTVETTTDDHYEQALDILMKRERVSFIAYKGYWQALKYSHMVLDMMECFLKNKITPFIHPSAQIAKTATIQGDVYIDEGVKIFEGAAIKGPAYIGKGAVIGDHTLVRESCIEAGAVIGFGSEVTRSYVGPRCYLHHNFIGDSILESDINPSYGTCTTNWRLDKKTVRIKYPQQTVDTKREKFGAIIAKGVFSGVYTVFMPGVYVSTETKILPNTTVKEPL